MAAKTRSEPVTVSGPGCDRSVISVGVGISLAQTHALRATAAGTWYVRENGRTVAVDRDEDGIVRTGELSNGTA